MTEESLDGDQLMRKRLDEIDRKIIRLEERFMDEEINGEQYQKFNDKLLQEKETIEKELNKASGQKSNLEDCISMAINFASKLRYEWLRGDYLLKQNIQYLLFPEGIFYDRKNDKCRTSRINQVFLYIAQLQQFISKKKRGIPELSLNYASLSGSVAGSRIELPTLGL